MPKKDILHTTTRSRSWGYSCVKAQTWLAFGNPQKAAEESYHVSVGDTPASSETSAKSGSAEVQGPEKGLLAGKVCGSKAQPRLGGDGLRVRKSRPILCPHRGLG